METRPIARCAENTHLLANAASIGRHVVPDSLQKLFAPEIVARKSLLRQKPLHHPLPGDAGVIGSRQPEGRIAEHPVIAGHDVLNADKQRVANVQLAGHVRRRHDDNERRAIVAPDRLK